MLRGFRSNLVNGMSAISRNDSRSIVRLTLSIAFNCEEFFKCYLPKVIYLQGMISTLFKENSNCDILINDYKKDTNIKDTPNGRRVEKWDLKTDGEKNSVLKYACDVFCGKSTAFKNSFEKHMFNVHMCM